MNDILLIEDDANEARRIEAALASKGGKPYPIERATGRSEALAMLAKKGFAIILLDLSLPDGQGITVFEQISQAAPEALIIILSSEEDEETARLAVQNGADDYLVKDQVDAHWLPRTLNYLIERKTTRQALTLSEARFRAMSDASPLGIFVSDIHGECIYTNEAYHTISGLSLEETLGTSWRMAFILMTASASWSNGGRPPRARKNSQRRRVFCGLTAASSGPGSMRQPCSMARSRAVMSRSSRTSPNARLPKMPCSKKRNAPRSRSIRLAMLS